MARISVGENVLSNNQPSVSLHCRQNISLSFVSIVSKGVHGADGIVAVESENQNAVVPD